MAFPSEWKLPLCSDGLQTPLFYSSPCEGTSLAMNNAVPSIPHNHTQRHLFGGHIVSASNPASVSPLSRPFVAGSHCAPHSFRTISAAQAECPEDLRLSKTVLGAMPVQEVHICVNQEVPRAGHGSTYVRNDPLLGCRGWAEEDLGPLSQDILRDADSLLSVSPSVLGESEPYNRDWTELDMIHFMHNLIMESEITCQWGMCGDRLKIKEIRTHLVLKHDIKSSPKPYYCFWNECSSGKQMTELPSLVRHVREQHGSAYKYWPCPTCEGKFTREENLLEHFEKCAGRRKLQAAPQG